MQGQTIVIHADGSPDTVTDVNEAVSLDVLQAAVGGYIETVPLFETYMGKQAAVAFCNEEGKIKGLPYNQKATKLWAFALGYAGQTALTDALYGDVIVLTGDEAFMESI